MAEHYLQWASKLLNENGYHTEKTIPDIVQDTPWSKVYRYKTNQGFIFLKHVPPALSIEPTIIDVLHKEFHAPVPHIIALNNELNCFLMADAGIQLHHFFKEGFKAEILIRSIHDYIKLQMYSIEKINLFIRIDVPDWRLEKLPKLYRELIDQEILLIDDGLNQDELLKLRKLESKLVLICEQLMQYKIKETFGHADYHDKNILINIKSLQTTLIDLGEVVITHPFFSLLNCIHRAQQNFSISDSQYKGLQIESFKPWLTIETQDHIFEILALIQQCWSIHSVLGEVRLLNSVDKSAYQKLSREGRIARNLRHWINQ